jgi:site-specific DNA-methyltransferase (adenine-specific)
MRNVTILGDCLELMKNLPDESIDLILCDLPYNTTRLKWDKEIDLDKLWIEYLRLITKKGAIVLFANQPFTSKLVTNGLKYYKYSWIWKKPFPTGFLNANYRPMLAFEDILVFSKSGAGAGSKNNNMIYNPQGLIEINKTKKNKANSRGQHIHDTENCGVDNILNSNKEYKQKFTGYPNNILEFNRDQPQLHPTQKPVALLEYLIKTYSNENELVLDNAAGVFSTAIACINTSRNYIIMEIDEEYFNIGENRIKNLLSL